MGRPRKRRQKQDDGEQVEGLTDDFGALGGGCAHYGEILQTISPHQRGGMSLPDDFLMDEFPFDFSDPLAWTVPDHDKPRNPQRLFNESQYTTSAINNQPPNGLNPTVLLDNQITHTLLAHTQTRSLHLSTPHYAEATSIPECSCVPNLYTSLSSFQTLPAPSFPLTLSLLRNATSSLAACCTAANAPKRRSLPYKTSCSSVPSSPSSCTSLPDYSQTLSTADLEKGKSHCG